MSDIYLSLTETPSVVTLSQPVVSGVLSSNVTVTNVVSVNVVTMPAITVQAAAPAVTTVAGSVAVSNFPASSSVTIGGFSASSLPPSTVTVANTVTINGTVTANVPLVDATLASGVTQGVPVYLAGGRDGVVIDEINYINYIPPISGTVTVGSLPSIAVEIESGLNNYAANYSDSLPIRADNPLPISGTVTARLQDASGNNLTSTSIGGVQRLNVSLASAATAGGTLPSFINIHGGTDGSVARTMLLDSSGRTVVTGTISAQGTVTAGMLLVENAANSFPNQNSPVQLKANAQNGSLRVRMDYLTAADANSDSVIGSTGTTDPLTNAYVKAKVVAGTVTIGNTVTVSQSGSVTANSIFPRVTLIDGSGTVTTANTAITVFASSSTRSYLLVQVTTGSAFVNVGATATTVNGINLTAGQGYAWETTIPQGIVSLISATTSSRYVAKEA